MPAIFKAMLSKKVNRFSKISKWNKTGNIITQVILVTAAAFTIPLFTPQANAASEIYNCDLALEKLDRLATKASVMYDADVQKQLAEISIINAPIFLSRPYLSYIDTTESNPVIHLLERGQTVSNTGYINAAQTVWEQTVKFYKQYNNKDALTSNTDYALTNNANTISQYGLTVRQYEQIGKIVKKIDEDAGLKNAAIEVLKESFPYYAKYKKEVVTAQARRKFFEKYPGEVSSREKGTSEDDESASQRRLLPSLIALQNYSPESGNIEIIRSFSSQVSTTETAHLGKLISLEYPFIWNGGFQNGLKNTIANSGFTVKEFLKNFKNYSNVDKNSIIQNTWDEALRLYDIFDHGAEDVKALPTHRLQFLQGRAKDLHQSIEDFYQTRMLLAAIENNHDARKVIFKFIFDNLKDLSEFASRTSSKNNNIARRQSFSPKNWFSGDQGQVTALSTIFGSVAGAFGGAMFFPTDHSLLGLAAIPTTTAVVRTSISVGSAVASKYQDFQSSRIQKRVNANAKALHKNGAESEGEE